MSRVLPSKAVTNDFPKENKKEEKLSKHKTIDKNFVKLRDKLKLKDIKEKKKLKKLEKSLEKSSTTEKSDTTPDKTPSDGHKSAKHLSLKGTLKPLKKSLGIKSSSDKKTSAEKKSSVVSDCDQNNASNASISDNKLG